MTELVKAMATETGLWWSDSSGVLNLWFKQDDAESVSGSGDQEFSTRDLLKVPYIAEQIAEWDMGDVREHLKGYGAWDDEELADDEWSLLRTLWLAGCDVIEEEAMREDSAERMAEDQLD